MSMERRSKKKVLGNRRIQEEQKQLMINSPSKRNDPPCILDF